MLNSIDKLSDEEKRALLARLLQDKIKTSRSRTSPLSFAQERLWFLDQFQPGTPVYNLPFAVQFPGPFNIGALRQSLNEIVRRHETLRTRFEMVDGEPMQVIEPAQTLDIPLLDLREMPATMREAEVMRLAAKEAQHIFDLARGPLFRALVVRVADNDHRLQLNMHHIISDGWSTGVLLNELGVLYDAYSSGRKSPLEELPLQYADFAQQQREYLSGERLAEQLDYWRQELAGAPAVLELPTDRPRPAVQTFHGAFQPFNVSRDVGEQLKRISRAEGATLFMTLLAAFKALLYRYSGQKDLVVGTPIANRNRADIEGLIGFFVNTLALRTQVKEEESFLELLRRVQQATLGAYGHQDLPFEKLVEELQPERNLSHNPLFQVMFALQNVPTVSNSDIAPMEEQENYIPPIFLGTAKFDMTLSLAEAGGGLAGAFEYNTDLFNHDTIRRLMGHFQQLLRGVAHNPEQRISELPLLSDAERQQLLVEWNQNEAELKYESVAELFEAQVARTPEATAVVFEEEQLSYAELNRRANQVAHYLMRRGAGPEVRVGICLERSLELAVGVLGILKAGAGYVPLDPNYPRERLAYILDDAQVHVLLTQERFKDHLQGGGYEVLCLDSDWPVISNESSEDPVKAVVPENLIAVIYTSGSTGKPKGTLLQAKGFLNAFDWFGKECLITGPPKVLLMTPFSFDASFKVIITPLLIGGVLVLASADIYDADKLLKTIKKQEVSQTFITPSLLYSLLDFAKNTDYADLSSLRAIFFGGEPTDISKLRPWLNNPNCNCQLVHNYGPSECSDVTTEYKPTLEEINTLAELPIGRAIQNVRVYVVDKNLNLQPTGVAGELCIAGNALSRGYLHRAELTAEKFVPNPFVAGERLYRTGDRVKWLPTGQLQFLGRIDNQVKIRGIRIEPGEIEAILNQHPGVVDSVVVAREIIRGDKSLVGYVVPEEQFVDTGELRRYLKERLPEHMVPPTLIVLEKLPLSPNGKVDRDALPIPNDLVTGPVSDFVEPRNPVEEVLTGIWSGVLNRERVGIHDNFFELGGHSLLATQVVSRVHAALQFELPVRRTFEFPTVAELSEWMLQQADSSDIEARASILLKIAQLTDEEAAGLLKERSVSKSQG